MFKIVLLRHGESIWNKENLFTGWTDVEFSGKRKPRKRVSRWDPARIEQAIKGAASTGRTKANHV